MEATQSSLGVESDLFDSRKLKVLARDISEVIFDWRETSTMERKIDPRLLEQVSRALHRCEDRPDQIRRVEDDLWHMDEPELGIALLKHSFLIKSQATEKSVVKQLGRLAHSQDAETRELTRDALKEAAYSEVERLQNIGCQALFESKVLSEEEVRGFARSGKVEFQHQLQAVDHLVGRQSALGPPAFVDLVTEWGSLRPSGARKKFGKRLRRLAHSFESYETLDRDFVHRLMDQLFKAADSQRLVNSQKRFIQMAMAALPERATEYIRSLGKEHLGSPSVIWTLGACSRRSPIATKALLEHAQQIVDATIPHRSRDLKWAGQQLKKTRRYNDAELYRMLDELIEAVQYERSLPRQDEVVAELEQVRASWWEGNSPTDLDTLLTVLARKFESCRAVEEEDAYDLRRAFESGRKPSSAGLLSKTEREVLIQAMDETAEDNPWMNTASWLAGEYAHFEGGQRIVIQNALACVAWREKDEIKTPLYETLLEFFEQCIQDGSDAEQEKASELLEKLRGERRPAPPSG